LVTTVGSSIAGQTLTRAIGVVADTVERASGTHARASLIRDDLLEIAAAGDAADGALVSEPRVDADALAGHFVQLATVLAGDVGTLR